MEMHAKQLKMIIDRLTMNGNIITNVKKKARMMAIVFFGSSTARSQLI
jgi:hypothetical protein